MTEKDMDINQETEELRKSCNGAPEDSSEEPGTAKAVTDGPETADAAGTEEEALEDGASEDAAEGSKGSQEERKEACDPKETAQEEHDEDGASEAPGDDKEEAGAKPDKKDKQIEELTDKYKRLFAEFDNFRKRTEQEKAGMYDEGERYVILKLLPVVDNFERALASVPEELKGSSYVDGIDKIYRSFTDMLTELKVKPIEAVGQPFDANLHNAVMHVEDESLGESIVAEEFQKGYMFRDKVLRYSMVKVAN